MSLNCRGISNKWDCFKNLICELQNDEVSFDSIGISEALQYKNDDRLKLTGFHDILYRCRENSNQGGVAMCGGMDSPEHNDNNIFTLY